MDQKKYSKMQADLFETKFNNIMDIVLAQKYYEKNKYLLSIHSFI